MPLVQVYMWPGRTPETKKQIVTGITKVFQDAGIPADAVEILLHEVDRADWAQGGVMWSDKPAPGPARK